MVHRIQTDTQYHATHTQAVSESYWPLPKGPSIKYVRTGAVILRRTPVCVRCVTRAFVLMYWIAPKIFIAWTSKRDSCSDDNETSSLFGQSASTLLLYVNIIFWLSVIPYSQRLPSDRNVKISLSPDRRRDAADAPDAVSVAAAVNERGLVLLLSSFRHTGCEGSTYTIRVFF